MERAFKPIDPGETVKAEALLRAAFGPYIERLGSPPRPEDDIWLADAVREGRVFGGYRDDVMAGVAAVSYTDSGWSLDLIAVDPSLQGKGIGRWLLEQVETAARDAGAATLVLRTAEIMTDLIALYQRHGYRETHRGPPPHGRDAYIRVFMEKRL